MKSRTHTVMLVGLLACSLAAFAQDTNQPATTPAPADNTAAAAPAATTNDTSAAATTPAANTNDTSAAAASTNAAPPTATASTDANQASTNATPTAATPAEAGPTPATPVEASANANPAGVVVPTIMMTEAPLTQAIDLLAREAKINYIIDPKVSFGPPGPKGEPAPAPVITFRWENVTAEQALTTLLATYSLQLVEDPKTTIARITIKDPMAPDPLFTKVIQLKYTGVSNILDSVRATFIDPKRSKVTVDTRTSQLVVVATEKEITSIDSLVERLDTPTKEVLIEAKLLETTINPSTFKGMDWSGTLQSQHLAFGNNLQQNTPANSVNNTLSQTFPKVLFDTAQGFNPATAFLDADGVNAVFSFINENSDARILSSPRTVTLDNEMARIDVTRATPIINVTAGTANTTGGSTITYTNLGVIMDVTPRITANNFVNLKVIPEVSRIFDTITKVVDGETFQADEYDIRRLQTQVMIPSGNTLVLGGLMEDDESESGNKVPILGDIPGLGAAFRSKSKTRDKDNLIVFITPTIVEDSDFHPTHTDFLQSPVDASEGKDWTAWDSDKPADWSAIIHHKESY